MNQVLKKEKGFTLLEALTSLALLSFILGASLQAYYVASQHFLKLKEQEENFLALRAALDKIRAEIQEEGRHLETAAYLKLVEPFKIESTSLQLIQGEWWIKPPSDLVKGQVLLEVNIPQKISLSRKILIHDETKGEIKELEKATRNFLIFTTPLLYSYEKESTKIILLRKAIVSFDSAQQKIRFQVNKSPAQPLAEDILSFKLSWKDTPPLLEIEIISSQDKENPLKQLVYLKNMALRQQNQFSEED